MKDSGDIHRSARVINKINRVTRNMSLDPVIVKLDRAEDAPQRRTLRRAPNGKYVVKLQSADHVKIAKDVIEAIIKTNKLSGSNARIARRALIYFLRKAG